MNIENEHPGTHIYTDGTKSSMRVGGAAALHFPAYYLRLQTLS